MYLASPHTLYIMSPSARRAWVEIFSALESWRSVLASPSARRAWVEIMKMTLQLRVRFRVALRKEGVG